MSLFFLSSLNIQATLTRTRKCITSFNQKLEIKNFFHCPRHLSSQILKTVPQTFHFCPIIDLNCSSHSFPTLKSHWFLPTSTGICSISAHIKPFKDLHSPMWIHTRKHPRNTFHIFRKATKFMVLLAVSTSITQRCTPPTFKKCQTLSYCEHF